LVKKAAFSLLIFKLSVWFSSSLSSILLKLRRFKTTCKFKQVSLNTEQYSNISKTPYNISKEGEQDEVVKLFKNRSF